MENFDNVYTVEMKTSKAWEVIFTSVSSQQALNEFCRCDAEDDGYQYRLTSMLTPSTEDETPCGCYSITEPGGDGTYTHFIPCCDDHASDYYKEEVN